MPAEVFRQYLLLLAEGAGLLVGVPALMLYVAAHKEIRQHGWRSVLSEFFTG